MRATERLLDQLNRAFGGEAWYGPGLRNLLDGVTEEHAKKRPVPNAHSILELVVHARTWMDVVARRISNTPVDSATVEDWSDISGTSWAATIEDLERSQSRLCDAVARLSTERLEQNVPGKPHSIYGEVLGVLEHNVYHAGQIAIIKKALGL